jgi:hypothetical protein
MERVGWYKAAPCETFKHAILDWTTIMAFDDYIPNPKMYPTVALPDDATMVTHGISAYNTPLEQLADMAALGGAHVHTGGDVNPGATQWKTASGDYVAANTGMCEVEVEDVGPADEYDSVLLSFAGYFRITTGEVACRVAIQVEGIEYDIGYVPNGGGANVSGTISVRPSDDFTAKIVAYCSASNIMLDLEHFGHFTVVKMNSRRSP